MATLLEMPKLSDTMVSGRIITWVKKEGDYVNADETIAEIETDKATMDLESQESGVLRKIIAHVDESVSVGAPLAVVGQADEDISGLVAEAQKRKEALASVSTSSGTMATGQMQGESHSEGANTSLRISPVAQRLAAEHGIDLSKIGGSGPGGRIVKRDVENYLATHRDDSRSLVSSGEHGMRVEGGSPAQPQTQTVSLVVPSQQEEAIPALVLETEVNAWALDELLRRLPQVSAEGHIVQITDVLAKAVAQTLVRHPALNSLYQEHQIQKHQEVQVQMSQGVNMGLLVSCSEQACLMVVPHCEQKSLTQIAQHRTTVQGRCAQGDCALESQPQATFTLDDLGVWGITKASKPPVPPQVAALTAGAIIDRPVFVDGMVEAGKCLTLTLSADSRVIDSIMAAQFMADLKAVLENPLALSL